jgi:hypothetical protein
MMQVVFIMKNTSVTTSMKLIIRSTALVALLACQNSYATMITHGNLETDDSTNYITNTVTGRQYTRFDTFDMTVAQTEAAIESGGAYEGWSIATWVVADDFISSALGVASTPCTGNVAAGTVCGDISGWNDADFGASYTTTQDYFAYMSAEVSAPISLVRFTADGVVWDYEPWTNGHTLDDYTGSSAINLLLYKDVPAPHILGLLGIGLLGVGAVKKRRIRKR